MPYLNHSPCIRCHVLLVCDLDDVKVCIGCIVQYEVRCEGSMTMSVWNIPLCLVVIVIPSLDSVLTCLERVMISINPCVQNCYLHPHVVSIRQPVADELVIDSLILGSPAQVFLSPMQFSWLVKL